MIHLTERFRGKEVYLIGTANQSTMLAQRTQKLIEQLKPDTVLVQTSQEWWNQATHLRYVDSQEELNKYGPELDRHSNAKFLEFYWKSRRYVFLARLYIYWFLFRWHYRVGSDFTFMRPGLEIKKACEAAERVGANLKFLGPELCQETWSSLYHETRMNVPEYIQRRLYYMSSAYTYEMMAVRQ